jgi:hypothetical protein
LTGVIHPLGFTTKKMVSSDAGNSQLPSFFETVTSRWLETRIRGRPRSPWSRTPFRFRSSKTYPRAVGFDSARPRLAGRNPVMNNIRTMRFLSFANTCDMKAGYWVGCTRKRSVFLGEGEDGARCWV